MNSAQSLGLHQLLHLGPVPLSILHGPRAHIVSFLRRCGQTTPSSLSVQLAQTPLHLKEQWIIYYGAGKTIKIAKLTDSDCVLVPNGQRSGDRNGEWDKVSYLRCSRHGGAQLCSSRRVNVLGCCCLAAAGGIGVALHLELVQHNV